MKGLAFMIGTIFIFLSLGFMWISETAKDDEIVRKLSHVLLSIYGIFSGVYFIVVALQ